MPELPEVERARKLIHETCKGYKIKSVDSVEDKIVFTGGDDHKSFVQEITGRTITGCERKGKTFWMTLSGKGRFPVMHFGMTGMIQLKGQEPTWYRRKPRESSKVWPPRFYKFVLNLEPQPDSVGDEPVELAFLDGRRLGRLRLLPDPVTSHPPVSALGFDPVLNHPTLDEFQNLIAKKKGTVKGMIMDQSFSAGVGNWVADEVLYQARIHPSCPVNHLSPQNIKDLHYQIRAVPLKAVEVNAESRQFPEDWLFRWRWSKGKKQFKGKNKAEEIDEEGEEAEEIKPAGKDYLALPNGKPATITFIEVGGRTTAVVEELQKMPEGVEIKPKISKGGKGSQSKKRSKGNDSDDGSSGLTSDDENVIEITTPVKATTARQRARSDKKIKLEKDGIVQNVKIEIDEKPSRKPRKSTSKSETEPPTSTRGKSTNGKPRKSKLTARSIKSRGKGSQINLEDGEGSSDLSDLPSDPS
ncbi:formamidopyrimidine-DNA glycosylase [Kwoniella mangroviensis CBS 8507]|uniref:formamidopyrimidine-DNA glycosylase n=1 Tax=Kwoniella mangroviensis CBS 8507 TaxID=1296122 RepID=UPI00080CFDCB|nr:formamidopyrimidine-DNA glycosylase [Kwoniella mangroviensis CBS 8507]OCF66378.1 formamidopyrimidine-DNA glycosylase [Kwoniella mangroviensis CBS 8507]